MKTITLLCYKRYMMKYVILKAFFMHKCLFKAAHSLLYSRLYLFSFLFLSYNRQYEEEGKGNHVLLFPLG